MIINGPFPWLWTMSDKTKISQRILDIDQCFGLAAGQSLAVPGRILIAEGVLTKSCRTGIKPRQFFLFNDILVYGSILVKNVQFTRQHIIPLQVSEHSWTWDMMIIFRMWVFGCWGRGRGRMTMGGWSTLGPRASLSTLPPEERRLPG